MARPLRVQYQGAVYHITSRGDGREDIYLDDKDRILFLEILKEQLDRYHVICYAYCLMSNHYHLLIETPESNLSLFMRQLNGIYTQSFNRCYRKVGHVFQGRYKSILVDKDNYLLEVCRYIVLNPVRARMVKKVEEWKWSSYADTIKNVRDGSIISSSFILNEFHTEIKTAKKAYVEFVKEGTGQKDSLWGKLQSRVFLGDRDFIKGIEKHFKILGDEKEISREERYACRPPLRDIFDGVKSRVERNKKIALSHIEHGYTLKEIGEHLNVHYSTVSKILKNSQFKT